MTSRYLLGVFDSAFVIAMTAWVGSIFFFTVGVSPIVFKVLGAEQGGKFVRGFSPDTISGARSREQSRCRRWWPYRFVIPSTEGRWLDCRPWQSLAAF